MEARWVFGFSGAWNSIQGIGSVAIMENLHQGERTSLCCNWNIASSSPNTFNLEKLVHIFQWPCVRCYMYTSPRRICSCYRLHNIDDIDMTNQNIFHIVGSNIILSIPCMWKRDVMFISSNFGIAQSPCIGLYRLTSFSIIG